MKPRVIFMGTPDFAVPALHQLASSDICDVCLVVTQPDRRAGRGKRLVSPPVKLAADQLGLPTLQVPTLRDPQARRQIIDAAPDLVVVAAFGMILGKWILELPVHGCVNLHASLLPKYRGANPIASVIAMGEPETGVSLMRMDQGLDTGPVYDSVSIPILAMDTTESLQLRLADCAGELLTKRLPALLAGEIHAEPQPSGATLTRLMTKDDGWLDFSLPAARLECHVRAMWPWPRAWTTVESGERMQVHHASVTTPIDAVPGTVTHLDRKIVVATREGALILHRIQMPGGKPLEGAALLQHPALAMGTQLGQSGSPSSRLPLVVAVDDESIPD